MCITPYTDCSIFLPDLNLIRPAFLRHPVLKMAYIFDSLGDVSARVLPVLRDVDGLKAVAGRLLVPASHTKVNIQERSRPDGEL